jgi:hypothetical protein
MPTRTLSDVEKTIQEYVKCVKRMAMISFPDRLTDKLNNYVAYNVGYCEKKFLVVYRYGMPSLEYEAFRKIPILLLDTEQY